MKKYILILLFAAAPLCGAQSSVAAAPLSTQNVYSNGPRYDVTQFGAAGTGYNTTGSIAVGTNPNLLTVANASGFAVRQRYNIPGAGVSAANLIITVTKVSGREISFTPAASTSVSNAVIDDTAGIQAAHNACWANGTGVQPYGGTVDYPGNHTYIISSTINAYDSCKIEGQVGGDGIVVGAQGQVPILWNGPAAGAQVNLTGFTVAANSTYYPASSPCPVGPCATPADGRTRAQAFPHSVAFTVRNSFAVGNWVLLQGFTATGVALNRVVAPVVQADGNSFTVVVPFRPKVPYTGTTMNGAYTDSGTAKSINVAIAYDSYARYQQEVKNIALLNKHGIPAENDFGAGFWLPRVDTGSNFLGIWVQGASGTYFDVYYANGGINTKFDDGWRTAYASIAQIYVRGSGGDNLTLNNGTANTQATGMGASLMIDQSACDLNALSSSVHMNNIDMEQDAFTIAPGLGVITYYDCPNKFFMGGLQLTLDNVQESGNTGSGQNNPGILVSPATNLNLQFTGNNFSLTGGNPARRFSGVPGAAAEDTAGASGRFLLFHYFAPIWSIGRGNYSAGLEIAIPAVTLATDVHVGQFWHYGVKAFDFLYGDTAFSAFASGTTLFAGQILAPPAYWNGANGKRYAIQVVYQTGTAGTLNNGATTCTTNRNGTLSTGEHGMVCSSATGLQEGQAVVLAGGSRVYIRRIDATNPASVLVATQDSPGANLTAAALSYVAPVLGPEMQFPSKSAAAPSTLAWSRGDWEQNSGAAANGIAAWVDVAAGTPGAWAAVPLGNAAGILNPAQAGVVTAIGTYTAATSDAFTVTGATSSSHCVFSPTNATAAASTVAGYISAVSAGSVTISHVANSASGGTVNILCTIN